MAPATTSQSGIQTKTPTVKKKLSEAEINKIHLPKLVLDIKIKLNVPTGIITTEGRSIIDDWMQGKDLPCLPDWWDYKTQVPGRGEYVGSFCKRVAKYCYQEFKIKLTSNQLGELGSIMSHHTNKNNKYILEYTQDLNWEAGDFGDEGSCFWSCHKSARRTLEEYGAYAIRFYDVKNSNRGIARAWICQQKNYYVLFNGYGLETSDIARTMAHHLNLSYRCIQLQNNEEKEGFLWINGSKEKSSYHGSGFVIAAESVVHGISEIDLKLEECQIMCYSCGEPTNECEDYMYDDQQYCENCFNEEIIWCEECEQYAQRESSIVSNHGYMICQDCAEDYSDCYRCGEYYYHEDMVEVDNNDICPNCIENYGFCELCKDWYPVNQVTDGICKKCQAQKDEEETD